MAEPRHRRERPGRAAAQAAASKAARSQNLPPSLWPSSPAPAQQPAEELPSEGLNSFSKLLYDANLCLNGYLDALKAASGENRQAQAFGNDAKGVGAA